MKDNRAPLETGTVIANTYHINSVVGMDFDCIIYSATNKTTGKTGVLKEVIPKDLYNNVFITRGQDNITIEPTLWLTDEQKSIVSEIFIKTSQLQFIGQDAPCFSISAFNTYCFLDTTVCKTLENIDYPVFKHPCERVLYKIMAIKKIAEIVSQVHGEGYLLTNLLSPNNIYISQNTENQIDEISFLGLNNAIPMDDIANTSYIVKYIKFKKSYAPQELVQMAKGNNKYCLGEHSDIFCLCKLLMAMLVDFPVHIDEISLQSICNNEDILLLPAQAQRHLKNIFISSFNTVRKRKKVYPNVSSFIKDLDTLIDLTGTGCKKIETTNFL